MERVLEVEPTQMSLCKTEQSGALWLQKGMAATSRAFPGFPLQFSHVQPPHLSDYLHGTPSTKVKNPHTRRHTEMGRAGGGQTSTAKLRERDKEPLQLEMRWQKTARSTLVL